jgi:hypothetical protein
VALTIAEEFARNGFTHQKSFRPVTVDGSGTNFIAGDAAPGLPLTAHTTSLYDFATALFAVADEASSRRIDDT